MVELLLAHHPVTSLLEENLMDDSVRVIDGRRRQWVLSAWGCENSSSEPGAFCRSRVEGLNVDVYL